MLDTQAQFMLADFQPGLESPHLLRVHATNAISCVAVMKVMLVTFCWKGSRHAPTYQHNLRDTQGRPSVGK